jgi:hypothetical protein
MYELIRASITKIPFLDRYRLLRASDIARLKEHNRLLTEAVTERARKLQEREAEFAEFATESGLKFQELQEHNQLLTEAATQSARPTKFSGFKPSTFKRSFGDVPPATAVTTRAAVGARLRQASLEILR